MVRLLRERGLTVTVFDLSPSAHDDVSSEAVDLRDEAAVEAAMERAWQRAPVGGVVVCHGIRGAYMPALEIGLDRLRLLYDVHVVGALAVSRALVRRLDGEPGSIVMVSSTTAYRGWANQADYGPAKAAERQLMENLAVEWAPLGVRVNAVAPATRSPRWCRSWWPAATTSPRSSAARRAAVSPIPRRSPPRSSGCCAMPRT